MRQWPAERHTNVHFWVLLFFRPERQLHFAAHSPRAHVMPCTHTHAHYGPHLPSPTARKAEERAPDKSASASIRALTGRRCLPAGNYPFEKPHSLAIRGRLFVSTDIRPRDPAASPAAAKSHQASTLARLLAARKERKSINTFGRNVCLHVWNPKAHQKGKERTGETQGQSLRRSLYRPKCALPSTSSRPSGASSSA